MNSIDIILLILLLAATIRGFIKGIIKELAGLVGVILGIFIGINGSSYTVDIFKNTFGVNDSWIKPAAFIVTFILVIIIIKLLAILLDKFLSSIGLSFLIRIGGAAIASIKAFFIIGIILIVLLQTNKALKGSLFNTSAIQNSSLAEASITITELFIPNNMFNENIITKTK